MIATDIFWLQIQPEGIPASSTPCFHQAYACDRVPNIIWPGKNLVTDESFCKDDFKPNPLSQDVTGESPRPAMQRISLPIILIIVVVSVLGLAGIALLARFAISRVKERYVSFKHFKYTSHIFRNGQVTSTKMVTTKNAMKMIIFLCTIT